MSRGGRGGGRGRGRGGRGGGGNSRKPMLNSVPWAMDPDINFDGKPADLFPPYNIPQASPLSRKEEKQVSYFLLFREQSHDSPLYTRSRTWNDSGSGKKCGYGQDPLDEHFGLGSKAAVNPFLAVPTYSQKFSLDDRTLPALETRPFAKEFFPAELHATLEGDDAGAAKRRKTAGGTKKTLTLSTITAVRTAEDLFLNEGEGEGTAGPRFDRALQALKNVEKKADGEANDGILSDDEDWVQDEKEGEDGPAEDPDQYDDESDDNDYNAEQYFDDGGEEDYDDGGGDDGGGGGGGGDTFF